MHNCSLDTKIKMNLEAQVVEKPTEVKKKSPERKKPTSTEPKAKRLKKEKDPNVNILKEEAHFDRTKSKETQKGEGSKQAQAPSHCLFPLHVTSPPYLSLDGVMLYVRQ